MADFQGQAATAQQANLDFFFGLASRMLEGEEKLVRLNLDTAKTTLADWHQREQDGLAKKDRQEVTGLQDALALHSAEKVLTYERQVAEIASTTQTQLAEVVNARYQEVSRQVQSFVENLAQNAPVGSEAAIAFLKQAITLANTTQESVQKATKQAVEVAQSNLDAATKAASEVTEAADQAVEKAAKAAKQ
ncbi:MULTISPECIES: TIGR01841 family phasin [unclassified Paraburkholderia]|uniref:TIGR01841 family phasin n=1 Tax=unclassified Paraburkholderia TaxID=2615204 RepID=UPI00161036E2|nr:MULTISPECIES: TIGR01841 family phasin [unclassified Paraburkholderia]MBB5409009.1 phasin family protein [Paraburkholderia sp. HC6.4b]MBB5450737.1 phasin family protein [Paraburkholderia sp. Kb1A]